MVKEPSKCEIHGLAFIRLVRKVVSVEEYNIDIKEYEPTERPIPRKFDQIEYLCTLCDNI